MVYTPNDTMRELLFVCTGNICRSPTAEGIARAMITSRGWQSWLQARSAGTHNYHSGEAPDARAQAAALDRGYNLSALRARAVTLGDIQTASHVLALDRSHLDALRQKAPSVYHPKIRLLMDYAQQHPDVDEVPDPYYLDGEAFEIVINYCEDAITGLLDSLDATAKAQQKPL